MDPSGVGSREGAGLLLHLLLFLLLRFLLLLPVSSPGSDLLVLLLHLSLLLPSLSSLSFLTAPAVARRSCSQRGGRGEAARVASLVSGSPTEEAWRRSGYGPRRRGSGGGLLSSPLPLHSRPRMRTGGVRTGTSRRPLICGAAMLEETRGGTVGRDWDPEVANSVEGCDALEEDGGAVEVGADAENTGDGDRADDFHPGLDGVNGVEDPEGVVQRQRAWRRRRTVTTMDVCWVWSRLPPSPPDSTESSFSPFLPSSIPLLDGPKTTVATFSASSARTTAPSTLLPPPASSGRPPSPPFLASQEPP